MRIIAVSVSAFLTTALLTACGGGGSSSGGGSPAPSDDSGQFVDSPVSGLEYAQGDDIAAQLTGPQGEFQFSGDEPVNFFIGGIQLGSVNGQAFITPTTLAAGSSDARTNLARFLQTLDSDRDPTNGISIAPAVREQAASLSITAEVFAVAVEDFPATEAAAFARSANGDDRALVDADSALAHLDSSEQDIEDGQFNYDNGSDTDSDGVNDAVDVCPGTPLDADIDSSGCAAGEASEDFDGDTIANSEDNCPADENTDQADFDADGRGDACDADADNDGLVDSEDPDPLTPDFDGDTVIDGRDNCPTIENTSQEDLDGDGRGDVCDDDRDGDGTPNADDPAPDDPAIKSDSDGDTIPDSSDNCPETANQDQNDLDGDGTGDACDTDRDGDNTPDDQDAFPDDPNEDTDTDGDGVGDNADAFPENPDESQDSDSDGTGDSADNCPQTANDDQSDLDGDGVGDACDSDLDGDGVDNGTDNCPRTANDQSDLDGDGIGDACDDNIDGDEFPNSEDRDNDNDGVDDNTIVSEDGTVVSKDEDFCHGTPLDVNADDVHTENATNKGCTDNQLAQGDYCADGGIKAAGGSFHELQDSENNLRSDGSTPQTVSFQLFEPEQIDCATIDQGAHPLILHGHGFGGSRFETKDNIQDYLNAGYAMISIDQRGFGDSSGTIRTMDPEAEGKDLIQILDWAEANLPYLAWKNDSSDTFIQRPAAANAPATSVANGDNLIVGAIGGSYGAGYQFLILAVDEKNRLDALAPDIGWHDLRYSLNPGDTIKTGWDLLLVGAGEGTSNAEGVRPDDDSSAQVPDSPQDRGLDPYIRETLARGASTNEFPRDALKWFNYHSLGFWCANQGLPTMPYQVVDWGESDQNSMTIPPPGGEVPVAGQVERTLPPVDVLLTQGFRDTLFNFNDGWWNYQCLSALGGDVRLLTHQSGHILPGVQGSSGEQACGDQDLKFANSTVAPTVLNWFEEKLKGLPADTGSDEVCLSLADGDAVSLPATDLLAPRGNTTDFTRATFASDEVPNGEMAVALSAGSAMPTVVELGTLGEEGILAGIPHINVTVSGPLGTNDEACSPKPSIPTFRTGCDSIVFVGIGQSTDGGSSWTLVDEQLFPLRGLGSHTVDLNGIAERIAAGDKLALLLYGFHPQFPASYSRDASIPAVTLEGVVDLPLYATAPDGTPDLDATADLAACGLPETTHPDENVTQEGSEELPQPIPTSVDFEVLDRDRDGCVQQYKTSNDASIDVVRTDERDKRTNDTSVFGLDVPDWVAYIKCSPLTEVCSELQNQAENLMEVGDFDNDGDNELRVNTPSSRGLNVDSDEPAKSSPTTSGINAAQWQPNVTADATGASFTLAGTGSAQPVMRVAFDASSKAGTAFDCKLPDTLPVPAFCNPSFDLKQGDELKAVFWNTTRSAGDHVIDFSQGGLHAVHLYLRRDGGQFERFAIHPCGDTTSLSTFDPTDGSCSSGVNAGWLIDNFLDSWTITEFAFDAAFNTDDPKFLILDDVQLILADPAVTPL